MSLAWPDIVKAHEPVSQEEVRLTVKRQPAIPNLLLALVLSACANSPTSSSPEDVPDTEVPPGLTNLLRFDGVDDRVTVPYDASFPTEVFTIAAEIKLTQPAGRAAVIARGEDDNSFNLSWQLYVTPSGNLEVMLEDSRESNFCYPLNNCAPRGSCTFGDLSVADDAWHHVAASRTGDGTLTLYIDGESRATCTGTGVPSSNNFQAMSIGSTFGTIGPPPGGVEPPTWFFPGLIDDPAVWNVALTPAQIADAASLGVDEQSAGLVGYWNFDEGAGQDVMDLSPAGNDGFRGANAEPDSADPTWEAEEGT